MCDSVSVLVVFLPLYFNLLINKKFNEIFYRFIPMPVYLKGISAEYSASTRLSQILSKITVSIKIYICCLDHFYRCSSKIILWNSRCFHSWVVHENDLLGVNIYFRIKKTRVTHIQPHYTPKWRKPPTWLIFFSTPNTKLQCAADQITKCKCLSQQTC